MTSREFQQLSAEDMKAVLRDEELYKFYVDSLMFIHDFLCEFSATQGRPRFAEGEVERRINDLFSASPHLISATIGENVVRNYEIARATRQEVKESRTEEKAFTVEEQTTLFLESLLEMYKELRVSRAEVLPKEDKKPRKTGSIMVGESLVGDGNEIAHIDLMIGRKDGPVGIAFANRLASQTAGHNALLALLEPNLPVKPDTVMFNKVTIKGARQAVHMFGPAQMAVAKAVADSVAVGVIPKKDAEDLCIVCGVFIHWEAADTKKIFEYNYQATKEAIWRAISWKPAIDDVLAKKDIAKHPFA